MNQSEKRRSDVELDQEIIKKSNIFLIDLKRIKENYSIDKIRIYRFVRKNDSIYVAGLTDQHREIMRSLDNDFDEILDGGFLEVKENKLFVTSYSRYLDSNGVSKETQKEGRNETIRIIKELSESSGSEYSVRAV